MLARRLSLLYATVFGMYGVFAPYWPKWLEDKGLQSVQLGTLLAVTIWMKILAGPLVCQRSDRFGRRRLYLILLSGASLASFLLFAVAPGFLSLLLVTVLFSFCLAPIVPLLEGATVSSMQQRKVDYGRVRLWGSLSFLATTVLVGALLDHVSISWILPIVAILLALIVLSCIALPETSTAPGRDDRRILIAELLRRRRFWFFLGAAGLVQASHACYYSFSAIYWERSGMDLLTVGLLWGIGVGVEILFFLVSRRLVRKLSAVSLLLLAAGLGTVRWTALAFSTDLLILIPAQCLHAATFAATQLGAMRYIERKVPRHLTATAQSLYSAGGMGVALGLATWVSGLVFEDLLGLSFLLMTGLCVLAGLSALLLSQSLRVAHRT